MCLMTRDKLETLMFVAVIVISAVVLELIQ